MWLDGWDKRDMASVLGVQPRSIAPEITGLRKRGWNLPHRELPRGAAHHRFNHGLCFDRLHGRWLVCCRDGTTMLYARAVMAAEVGRLLRPEEIVHHRNEDKTDDRPENLELTTQAGHIEMHRAGLRRARGIAA